MEQHPPPGPGGDHETEEKPPMALKPRPPAVRENAPKFLANPFELSMSLTVLVSMAATIKLLLSPLYDALPPVGLAALPEWLMWGLVTFGTVSGLLMLGGVTLGTLKARARALEAAGLWLALAVWTAVTVCDLITEIGAWGNWGLYITFALGPALRLWAMRKYERAVTRALERTESVPDDEQGAGADGDL